MAQVPVPAAQVPLTPRLVMYLYATTEVHLLCEKTLLPEEDYRIQGDAFIDNVEVATTDEEKDWMNDFLTAHEINVTSTLPGLGVTVIDKYENVWILRLQKRNEDDSYILSGRNFNRFKVRQRFTPGWIYNLWVARGIAGRVIMSMDFQMGDQH